MTNPENLQKTNINEDNLILNLQNADNLKDFKTCVQVFVDKLVDMGIKKKFMTMKRHASFC